MAAYFAFYSLLALFLVASNPTRATPNVLPSALSISSQPPRKALVKRPVIPTEPACDADYGQPDYLACLIATSWIPVDGSDPDSIRLFGPMPETPTQPLAVQLPKTISAGQYR